MQDVMSIVTAAATAVGPVGDRSPEQWQDDILDMAIALQSIASEHGLVGKYMAAVDRVEEHVANNRPKQGKIFVATVKSAIKEKRTGRALITLTTFDKNAGQWKDEVVRTDFLDSDDGIGYRLASMARQLIGHRARLWVELESKNDGSGQSVRMLRHIEDRGVDEQFESADAA